MKHRNTVEFKVIGEGALFSDPVTRVGGEKCTYQIPTYEAMKGVMQSIYWKPTLVWIIDEIRVMNQIQMETRGIRTIKYHSKKNENDLSYYTYLKNCCYQVRAHFEWNQNRPDLEKDRNENKHHNIAKRMIEKGGRRDIYLGTRECQAYVEPCIYGEDKGFYDDVEILDFGTMYHGITYADEAYSDETRGKLTVRLWHCKMKNGVILFERPEKCVQRVVRNMQMKHFGEKYHNFTGVGEFKEVE